MNGNPTVEVNYLLHSGLFNEESSALSIPLFRCEEVIFGALTLYSAKPNAFTKHHLSILQQLEPIFSLALQAEREQIHCEADINHEQRMDEQRMSVQSLAIL